MSNLLEVLLLIPIALLALQGGIWLLKIQAVIHLIHRLLPVVYSLWALGLILCVYTGTLPKEAVWVVDWLPNVPIEFNLTGIKRPVWAAIALITGAVLYYVPGYAQKPKKSLLLQTGLLGFSLAATGLLLTSNLLAGFFFWELTGLFSFLLIGFRFSSDDAPQASFKAILTAKLGDVILLFGILWLFAATGSFNPESATEANMASLQVPVMLMFAGSLVKAAQAPFFNWLHHAMAGPVPVSALMHAMALVGAPFFFLSKIEFLFGNNTYLDAGLILLAFSTIWSALQVLQQTDIKKALAWSTASQMSWPLLALLSGNAMAGAGLIVFHGLLKYALFLWAGKLSDKFGTQDLRAISGLYRSDKILALTGLLLLAGLGGIPLFGTFFAKELILDGFHSSIYAWAFWLMAAGITAFYVAVLFFRIASGPKQDLPDSSLTSYPVYAGIALAAIPFNVWMLSSTSLNITIQLLASVMILGIGFTAGQFWHSRSLSMGTLQSTQAFLETFINNKVPDFYLKYGSGSLCFLETKIERFFMLLGRAIAVWGWIASGLDKYLIDGLVTVAAYLSKFTGGLFQSIPGGKVQLYLTLALAALAIFIWLIP